VGKAKKVVDPLKGLVQKANDYVASLVRTGVMLAVGYLLAWAGRHGLDLHVAQAQLDVVATSVYYIVVRAMEHYVDPKFGWLLGLARKPAYDAATAADAPTDPPATG